MRINITVLKTNLKTNERVFNDFIFNDDDDWNQEDIELLSVNSKRMLTMNEYANAWLFLSQGFGEQLQLSENIDIEDFENIFQFILQQIVKREKEATFFR